MLWKWPTLGLGPPKIPDVAGQPQCPGQHPIWFSCSFPKFPLHFPLNQWIVIFVFLMCYVTWCLLGRLLPTEKSCKVTLWFFPMRSKFYVSKFTKYCPCKSISYLERCTLIQHCSKQKPRRPVSNGSNCYAVNHHRYMPNFQGIQITS